MRKVRREQMIATPCAYCGELMAAPTKDHVQPKSKGGANHPGNILFSCYLCNNEKGDLSLQDWALRLAFNGDPRAPRVTNILERRA